MKEIKKKLEGIVNTETVFYNGVQTKATGRYKPASTSVNIKIIIYIKFVQDKKQRRESNFQWEHKSHSLH